MDAPHVYVRALALDCFYSHISTGTFRVAGQLRGDKECPFSDVTKSGRVWKKVPEIDARSVGGKHTPSIVFRHLFPRKDVVNQCLEFGRKVVCSLADSFLGSMTYLTMAVVEGRMS